MRDSSGELVASKPAPTQQDWVMPLSPFIASFTAGRTDVSTPSAPTWSCVSSSDLVMITSWCFSS